MPDRKVSSFSKPKRPLGNGTLRFDHGYSQIIDWSYKLEDMKKSDAFAGQFGARSIDYAGILLAGREHFLQPPEKERLEWRRMNVIVASRNIHCVTFDGLLEAHKPFGNFLTRIRCGGLIHLCSRRLADLGLDGERRPVAPDLQADHLARRQAADHVDEMALAA